MDGPLPTSETNESAPDQPPATPEAKQAGAVLQNQEFDYLDDLMDMLQVQGERESGSAVEMAQSATPPPQYSVGQAFIEWLREGVNSHRLVINDSKAKSIRWTVLSSWSHRAFSSAMLPSNRSSLMEATRSSIGGAFSVNLRNWAFIGKGLMGKTFGLAL